MLALFVETHQVFAPIGVLFDDETRRRVDFTVVDGATSVQMRARGSTIVVSRGILKDRP
jgi:hypothetical protein